MREQDRFKLETAITVYGDLFERYLKEKLRGKELDNEKELITDLFSKLDKKLFTAIDRRINDLEELLKFLDILILSDNPELIDRGIKLLYEFSKNVDKS